jgi:hypothetical protein
LPLTLKTVTVTSSPTISVSFTRLVNISISLAPCHDRTSHWIVRRHYVEDDAAIQRLVAPVCYPDMSATRCLARSPVKVVYVFFQLPECTGVKCFELYANVKNVLCETFGVNNPGAGLDDDSLFIVRGQVELDINLDIHDQANSSFAIGNDVVDGILGTAEFQSANRKVEYLCGAQGATRLPDFTG